MHSFFLHIRHPMKKLLAPVCFILLYTSCFAQQASSDTTLYVDTTTVDSIYSSPSNDEELPEFDSLTTYDIPSYQTYEIEDSLLDKLKKDDAFWYANTAPKRQKQAEAGPVKKYSEPFYLQNWFKTLVWVIIIGAFIAVLIWFLIASDIRLFRKKPNAVKNETEVAISEDIFAVDYDHELAKAITTENYALGVRLMYLHVLRLLSEKGLIQYKIERTNSDYILQLYNTSYYNDFFRLTRNFEYVWYGKFDISSAAFEMIRQDYTKIKNIL